MMLTGQDTLGIFYLFGKPLLRPDEQGASKALVRDLYRKDSVRE